MKKIVYVGIERCDIVYHLATILSLQAGKVVVIDNSKSHDLMASVNRGDDEYLYEWRNIIFTKDADIENSEELNDADVVIEYAGLNTDCEFNRTRIANDTNVIWLAMPDYTRHSLSAVNKMQIDNSDNIIYIPRDYCSKKVTDKSLAMLLNISPKNIAGHIPLNTQDLASYVALTHNGHQNIKSVSDITYEVLTYLVGEVTGETDNKKLKKMMSMAKKIK